MKGSLANFAQHFNNRSLFILLSPEINYTQTMQSALPLSILPIVITVDFPVLAQLPAA